MTATETRPPDAFPLYPLRIHLLAVRSRSRDYKHAILNREYTGLLTKSYAPVNESSPLMDTPRNSPPYRMSCARPAVPPYPRRRLHCSHGAMSFPRSLISIAYNKQPGTSLAANLFVGSSDRCFNYCSPVKFSWRATDTAGNAHCFRGPKARCPLFHVQLRFFSLFV